MSSSLLVHAAPSVSCGVSKCSRSCTPALPARQRLNSFRPFSSTPTQRRNERKCTSITAVGKQQVVAIAEIVDTEENVNQLPKGYDWYETLLILRSTLSEEERDKECAKFEVFLSKNDCMEINSLVRGRSRLAYPIRQNWEGYYVLYTYAAKRSTAAAVQNLLSKPDVGSEDNIIRWMQFRKSENTK